MPEFSGSQHAYTCLPGLSIRWSAPSTHRVRATIRPGRCADGRPADDRMARDLSNERGTSDFGTIEIASRTSADGGRTWGDERILVRPDLTEDLSVQAPALRRLESGDPLLMCLHPHRADGEGELAAAAAAWSCFACATKGRPSTRSATCGAARRASGCRAARPACCSWRRAVCWCPFTTAWAGRIAAQPGLLHAVGRRGGYLAQGGGRYRSADARRDGGLRRRAADGELVLLRCARSWARSLLSRCLTAASTGACRRRRGCARPESHLPRAIPGTDDLILCWIDIRTIPRTTTSACARWRRRWRAGPRAELDAAGQRRPSRRVQLFDIGCDFVDDETAILTYGFTGRTTTKTICRTKNGTIQK